MSANPPDVTEVVVATLVTTSGLLEVDSEAGWLAVVREGEGAGDVCSCTLPSLVEEAMTVHWIIPIKFPASLPTIRTIPAHILGFYEFCGTTTTTYYTTLMVYTYIGHDSVQISLGAFRS